RYEVHKLSESSARGTAPCAARHRAGLTERWSALPLIARLAKAMRFCSRLIAGVRRFASRSFAVSRIYIPAVSAEQWAQFLAEPSKHWRSGYSARALAYAWQEANGFPAEIQAAFDDTAH